MNKDKIKELYDRFKDLPKEDILNEAIQIQTGRIRASVLTSGAGLLFGSVPAGVIAASYALSAAASPETGNWIMAATGAGFATGLGALSKSEKITAWVNKIGGFSESLRDKLADRISAQEGIPKSEVFSRTIRLGDRDALVALAFEKHKTVVDGSPYTENDKNFNYSANYRSVDAKFKAINMHEMDEAFFNNAYKFIENRYGRSDFHYSEEYAGFKNDVVTALLFSENGTPSKDDVKKIDNASPSSHASTYKTVDEDLDVGESTAHDPS